MGNRRGREREGEEGGTIGEGGTMREGGTMGEGGTVGELQIFNTSVSGVSPFSVQTSGHAPFSSNQLHTVGLCSAAAKCSGVQLPGNALLMCGA